MAKYPGITPVFGSYTYGLDAQSFGEHYINSGVRKKRNILRKQGRLKK